MFQSSPAHTKGRRSGRRATWATAIGAGLLAVAPSVALAGDVVPNPDGEWLVRRPLSIPANPIASGAAFNAELVASRVPNYELDGTISSYSGKLADNRDCRMKATEGRFHPYVVDTIEIIKQGTFTFRIVLSPGVDDPFLALYGGTFNPLAPNDRVIGCNDDGENYGSDDPFADNPYDDGAVDGFTYPTESNDLWSEFTTVLPPGTYTIMLATFTEFADDASWYVGNGDSGVTPAGGIGIAARSGKATAWFEYWGPPGGIALKTDNSGGTPSFGNDGYLDYLNERVAAETASDLPNTGSTVTALNMVVALGCLAAGSTLIVVSRRRRFS